MSQVEDTLRAQREIWREVYERVSMISSHELPPEAPGRILLFGIGSSHFAAKLTGFSLIRAKGTGRFRVPVVSCSSLAIQHEVIPRHGDFAFGFTHRGRTAATRQALDACARAGAFTLLVAGQGLRDLAADESIRFYLPTSPMEKVEVHTMSVSAAVCAVTTLLLGGSATEEWDAVRSIGDPNLDVLRSRVGQGPSVLVGEWEGEWLAREGALKLMEMARLAARAFGSEEFFHGPQRSVPPELPLWHVSMDDDSRNEDIARIRPAYRVDVRGRTPMAWVPALVELQWLSLAVALNRGMDPDGAEGEPEPASR